MALVGRMTPLLLNALLDALLFPAALTVAFGLVGWWLRRQCATEGQR